jgi:hypothetical protein
MYKNIVGQISETVLQAIGLMFALLPSEKVTDQVPRLVPVLLGLYRRNVDPYPITQCLSAVLDVALSHNRSTVEPLLDNLQNIMFDLVSAFTFLIIPGKVVALLLRVRLTRIHLFKSNYDYFDILWNK